MAHALKSHKGTKFTLGTDALTIANLGYQNKRGKTCLDVLNDLSLTNKDLKWKPIMWFGKIN